MPAPQPETTEPAQPAAGKREPARAAAAEDRPTAAAAGPAGLAAALEPAPAREPRPPLILPPAEPAAAGEQRAAQMLTITLKANGDRLRDALKIQRIFGLLISEPGIDRFAFYVFEGPKSYLVEFPNYTTRVDEELLANLRGIMGVEAVQVEPIIYQ